MDLLAPRQSPEACLFRGLHVQSSSPAFAFHALAPTVRSATIRLQKARFLWRSVRTQTIKLSAGSTLIHAFQVSRGVAVARVFVWRMYHGQGRYEGMWLKARLV